MPRTRSWSVEEPVKDLLPLERRYRSEWREGRIRMLLYMRRNPHAELQNFARIHGYSERTVYRWSKIYRTGGLDALLHFGEHKRKRSSRIPKDRLVDIRHKVEHGHFSSITVAQRWILDHFGVTYSYSGMRDLLGDAVGSGLHKEWRIIGRETEITERPQSVHNLSLPDGVIKFLNTLPSEKSVVDSIAALRIALMSFLPDVDRVSISLTTSCNLENPGEILPDFSLIQDATVPHRIGTGVAVQGLDPEVSNVASMVEQFRESGYPVDLFHEPMGFDFYFKEREHLATLLLWRERQMKPIPSRTAELVESLRSFLTYVFTNLVIRQRYERPDELFFHDALREMSIQAQLTQQERRVIHYRLLGYSYKAIADEMGISTHAVKRYLKSVYTKTETAGHVELVARYFTALLIPAPQQ